MATNNRKSLTPHNNAQLGEIASVVLLPGDPNRAKLIAEKLSGAKCYSDVRGICVYTGTYNGKRITVMASGMGNPSIGIYTYELYNIYKVKTIIRIGTSGSYVPDLKIGELFIASESYGTSPYAKEIGIKPDKKNLLKAKECIVDEAKKIIEEKKLKYSVGRIHCTDTFYAADPIKKIIKKTKAKCVEMESYALYANAKKFNANALAILYCTDNIATHESLPANERTYGVSSLIEVGLELAKKFAD